MNFGDDLWDTAGLLSASQKEEITANDLWLTAGKETGKELDGNSYATVVLREKAKYLDVQNARDIHYSDDRTGFPSDAAFANFRQFSMGSIAPGKIYRSASPCDNQHNRAPYVDALIAEAGVSCILNLCDNESKMQGYIEKDGFNSPYFLSLHDSGKIIPLALNANYTSAEFASKVAGGFREMTAMEGPYLVHCTEGKDRTGFVCMLIEALAGAGYMEMADDYMVTYDNYYEITPAKDPDKYDVILEKNFDTMLQSLAGDPDADLNCYRELGAFNYVLKAKQRGVTRSYVSMERALKIRGPKLLVCGNAPTFLLSLLEISQENGLPEDTAVVGVPVGFVNGVEAKEKLWQSGLPCIAAMGRRGGSNVAAAIVNALLYGIEGVRA